MIERFTQGKLLWINLSAPTNEEIHEVMHECALPPGLISDFGAPIPRSEARLSDRFIKIVLDFPTAKQVTPHRTHEIKFLISKEFLITVQYEEMEALDRYKKEFEVVATLQKASKTIHGGHLFVSLMHTLYSVTETKIDYLESKLTDIESELFKKSEKQMVFEISDISKKLITFRQALKAHDEVLRDARVHFETLFKESVAAGIADTHGHYGYILKRTTSLLETLDALRETNMAVLVTKQNEIMKTLTIMAFVTFPLTLFSSLFGMNTLATPIIGSDHDFWIIVGVMAMATVCFFGFFKYKRWM